MRPRPLTFSAHASRLPSSETPIGLPTVSATVRLWPVANVSDVEEPADAEDGDLVVRADLWRRRRRDGDRADARFRSSSPSTTRASVRSAYARAWRARGASSAIASGVPYGRDVRDRHAGADVDDLDRQVRRRRPACLAGRLPAAGTYATVEPGDGNLDRGARVRDEGRAAGARRPGRRRLRRRASSGRSRPRGSAISSTYSTAAMPYTRVLTAWPPVRTVLPAIPPSQRPGPRFVCATSWKRRSVVSLPTPAPRT